MKSLEEMTVDELVKRVIDNHDSCQRARETWGESGQSSYNFLLQSLNELAARAKQK